MDCQECKAKLKVVNSRQYEGGLRVRDYKCPECGCKDRTTEQQDNKIVQEPALSVSNFT